MEVFLLLLLLYTFFVPSKLSESYSICRFLKTRTNTFIKVISETRVSFLVLSFPF